MKGTLTDVPIILAVLLSSALGVFVVFYIISALTDAWTVKTGPGNESYDVLLKGVASFKTFDYMFLFFFFGLSAFTIISGFYIDSNPIFFVFSFFLTAVNIFISAVFIEVFDMFVKTEAFLPVANQFPFIVTLMYNLPVISLVLSLLVAIVVHGKPFQGGTG